MRPPQLFLSYASRATRTSSSSLHTYASSTLGRTELFFSGRSKTLQNPNLFNPILRRTFANGYRNGPNGSYTSARLAIRTIIGLNTAVFGTWYYAQSTRNARLLQWLSDNFTLSISNYQAGRYWTLLTPAFSHQNFMHFLFNMFALNAFGSILAFVPGLGAGHIISLCLGSAVTGSFAFLYTHGLMDQPRNSRFPNSIMGAARKQFSALGASGMVMGAGLAATCLMPMAPMALLFPPVTLPLWALMAIYMGFDLYFWVIQVQESGTMRTLVVQSMGRCTILATLGGMGAFGRW